MGALHEALGTLSCGEVIGFQNLSVWPLVSGRVEEPDYLTLDEALERGEVRITETSEAGEVPELRLDNRALRPVLLLDGEELLGAKQNRVLNLTVLAPAQAVIRIPVSCVEAGRWSPVGAAFRSGARTLFASARARKASHVTDSLRGQGTRRSRQGEVWDDIRVRLGRLGSHSPTEAMARLYEDHEGRLAEFLNAIPPLARQVGAVFAINGRICGIELFDFPATLLRLYPKLLRGYALDALDASQMRAIEPTAIDSDPQRFMTAVAAADGSAHAAVGEGSDIRLSGPRIVGGALQARGRLVHLSAFLLDADPADRLPGSARADATAAAEREADGRRAQEHGNGALLEGLFRQGVIRLERSPLFDRPVAAKGPRFDFGRVEGMLLGIAIGDGLGITTEGMLPGHRRARHGEIRDYLPNRYVDEPRGFPSDDTQLSFWTLEQLVADGGLRPERLARRFCSGHIFGIGQTVRQFIGNFKAGQPWYACGPASAGNGALMRIAPVLIPHLSNGGTGLWADAALAAMLTHNDRASTSACVAFTGLLWELLDMERPPAPQWWVERYVTLARGLEGESRYAPRGGAFLDYRGPLWRFVAERVPAAHARGLTVLDAGHGWHSGAFLLETVPSVLYILMRHGHDPQEAIVRAVNDTKDNDTIAAIVGAAVGALHGRRALPPRWVANLSGRTTDRDDGRVFELIACARRAFWA